MSNVENQISEQFAKQLLKSLYKLDGPIGSLDSIISKIDDIEIKKSIADLIGEIMYITLNDLMVPIYRQRPELGRASEPGAWLSESTE